MSEFKIVSTIIKIMIVTFIFYLYMGRTMAEVGRRWVVKLSAKTKIKERSCKPWERGGHFSMNKRWQMASPTRVLLGNITCKE